MGHLPFVHPVLERRQHPGSFLQSVRSVRKLIEEEAIEIAHSHLTHDHWLLRFLFKQNIVVVRSFHSKRALRSDPITRHLIRKTDGICVVNRSFIDHPLIKDRPVTITPPPLDTRQFFPAGANARSLHSIPDRTPLVGMIGKVSPGRGFEEGIKTFAVIAARLPLARMLVIGRGPHRPFLEGLIRSLDLEQKVTWAGYHEDDLAEHYRAIDVMLFTAPGSDQGHRALLESLGCGTPMVSYPIDGVEDILGDLSGQLRSSEDSPESLADLAVSILERRDDEAIRNACVERASHFSYPVSARRLIALYEGLLGAK
ncbi:MAG TPA: glycosyltransferase family 4 protein [Thermoanaerobaculia bacterium]|nr:glycosyltransferase family 4 protein [Thermoanaerobaculia bacterium]